jgi:hypothetical protein
MYRQPSESGLDRAPRERVVRSRDVEAVERAADRPLQPTCAAARSPGRPDQLEDGYDRAETG